MTKGKEKALKKVQSAIFFGGEIVWADLGLIPKDWVTEKHVRATRKYLGEYQREERYCIDELDKLFDFEGDQIDLLKKKALFL